MLMPTGAVAFPSAAFKESVSELTRSDMLPVGIVSVIRIMLFLQRTVSWRFLMTAARFIPMIAAILILNPNSGFGLQDILRISSKRRIHRSEGFIPE